jgi:hypothetical protein
MNRSVDFLNGCGCFFSKTEIHASKSEFSLGESEWIPFVSARRQPAARLYAVTIQLMLQQNLSDRFYADGQLQSVSNPAGGAIEMIQLAGDNFHLLFGIDFAIMSSAMIPQAVRTVLGELPQVIMNGPHRDPEKFGGLRAIEIAAHHSHKDLFYGFSISSHVPLTLRS